MCVFSVSVCLGMWVKTTVTHINHLPPSTHPAISRAAESKPVIERLIKGPRTDLWRPFERTSRLTQVDMLVRALAQTYTWAQGHTHKCKRACSEAHTSIKKHHGFQNLSKKRKKKRQREVIEGVFPFLKYTHISNDPRYHFVSHLDWKESIYWSIKMWHIQCGSTYVANQHDIATIFLMTQKGWHLKQ